MKQSNDFKAIGRNVKIYPLAKIIGPETISLGDEVVIDDLCFIYSIEGGIEFGDFSHLCVGTILMAGGLLKIGNFTTISPGCIIMASTESYDGEGLYGHPSIPRKYRNHENKETVIGDLVHVGMGSRILPGVHIGEGVSIGSGSVVTRDLPPWTICYGSPCKPHRDKPQEKILRFRDQCLEEYHKKEQP